MMSMVGRIRRTGGGTGLGSGLRKTRRNTAGFGRRRYELRISKRTDEDPGRRRLRSDWWSVPKLVNDYAPERIEIRVSSSCVRHVHFGCGSLSVRSNRAN